jgi:hypothetical protein
MQELTKQTIQKLLLKTQHVVHVNDFDDIEALDKLANSVTGVSKIERRLLNSPFELCGILFYPLTVAKSLWFTEKVKEWDIEGAEQEGLLFWLLSLPLTDKALDDIGTMRSVESKVKKLSRKLHCSSAEISEIYRKCVGVDSDGSSKGVESDYGGTIACLIKEYGGTPDLWLYETPVEKMASLFDQYERRIIAEESSSKVKSARSGKAVAPNMTVSMKSLGEFQAMARKIEEKWSLEDGN